MAAFLAILIFAVILFATSGNKFRKSDKVVYSATIFPVYDLAREIAGDRADVRLILPQGASPHTFEITPEVASRVSDSKAVFKIGVIDDWIDSVSGDKLYKVDKDIPFQNFQIKEFGEEEEAETGYDPHYWTIPSNAEIMAKNIYDRMIEIDPEGKEAYSANYARLNNDLIALDEEIKQELQPFSGQSIITFHDAWGYFVDRYNLKIAAVLLSSPGKEITPGNIKAVGDAANLAHAKAVFYEPEFSQDVVDSFAKDYGLKTGVLDAEGGMSGDTYVTLMRRNVRNITNALR